MKPDEIAQEIGRAFVEVMRKSCKEYIEKYPVSDEITGKMTRALHQLTNLASRKPDYNNPTLPFFYVSWYHLRHVRMCCSILERLQAESSLDLKNRNIVMDMGCGAFATLWGIIYFSAYCKALNVQENPKFIVHLFDTSKPLLKIGQSMHENLREYAEKHRNDNSAMAALHDAIEAIQTSEPRENIHELELHGGNSTKIITGIHILYKEDGDFHNDMINHMKKEEYDYAVFSHDSRIHNERKQITNNFLKNRLPKEGWKKMYQLIPSRQENPKWNNLTESLKELRQEIGEKYGINDIQSLLSRSPKAIPEKARCHFFFKKGMNSEEAKVESYDLIS